MALDFPDSPTIGDEFTGGGFTWVWDGTSWSKTVAAAGSADNNRTIDLRIGSSGNTTIAIDPVGPAGDYLIDSTVAGDVSYEIYFLAADGTLVGFVKDGTLVTVSTEFTKIVIYGATTNDLIRLQQRQTESPTSNGDISANVPPFVTSATPTTLESIDDTTTVTGGNFATDVSVKFVGQDAVDRSPKTVVRSSSTELIVTRPDDFPLAQEPYSLVVTNPGVTPSAYVSDTLTDYFDAGGGITWVTASDALAKYTVGSPYTDTVEATDADGLAVTYAVQAGTLPSGLSLNSSTGEISGTVSAVDNQTFTIRATDTGGNTSDREFSIQEQYVITAEYLVVAGGGGGHDSNGGGGGAGGYRNSTAGETSGANSTVESTIDITAGDTLTLTVGAGGAYGTDGFDSVFGSITSDGGGGCPTGNTPNPGGSGGGAASFGYNTTTAGGAGTAGQGLAGGQSINTTGGGCMQYAGGGGGGAGQTGFQGYSDPCSNSSYGGDGGDGLQSSITTVATYRAGGGGGGNENVGRPKGVGGLGGGGNGGSSNGAAGTSGTVNTGGGGGGRRGNGGSGVVIIRYSDTKPDLLNIGAGVTYTKTVTGGYKIYEFTAGTDTITV